MSEASKRVLAWREQKREDGYQPVTIWIPARVKNQMVNDAFQRHQDLSELIAEVYLAHPPARSGRGAALMDRRQIEALVQEQVAQALASHSPPAAVLPPLASAPVSPPLAGKKQCRQGHPPYAAKKKECPGCVAARTARYRQRKADKRRGEVPI